MTRRTLAIISAGLSQPSSTRLLADRLAAATVAALDSSGIEVDLQVIEVRDIARDVANNLVTGFPSPELKTALDTVAGADGVIAVAPTFRASFSGLFKSFIDVLDDKALESKPVLIGATGGSSRHSLVLEHAMRPVLTFMHAVVMPTSVFAAAEDWSAGDNGTPLSARIHRAAAELAAEMERRGPAAVPDPFALNTDFSQLLMGD